ncbi:MAG: ABC transporter permease subunit [Desulfoprunum sp.]|nr:ABC transporter permease subunit [Desulfoprunum sp.]
MRRTQLTLRLLPLLLPILVVFGCGLTITVLQSFGLLMFSYTYDDLFFAYRELFADSWFLRSAAFSLYVALASSSLSIVLGTALAYAIWKLPVRQRHFTIIYKIPLVLPHIAVGFLAVVLLAKTGIVSAIAYHLALIDSFEHFPDLLYTPSGIDLISAYIYKETPFVMVMVYAMLVRFDRRQIDTARMLWAGGMRIFFSLILPFIMPAINTTFIILFIFTFGGFDLPFVLGDSFPGMLSIRIYDYFFQKDIALRPVAMAMLTLIFGFSLIFIAIYLRLSARLAREVRKL